MTEARIEIGPEAILVGCEGTFVAPCGAVPLADRHFTSDPPHPEDLTNAIGEVTDHFDDAKRELPALASAERVVIVGSLARAVAAIERGATVDDASFLLSRDAAEDVFRTVATEGVADRRRNPGLPADLVDQIVGGCCALVAILRTLHLGDVVIEIEGVGDAPGGRTTHTSEPAR